MPVKQLSRVSPALPEGSFPRAAGDRAVKSAARRSAASVSVCLLTGGDDRPYALGMASAPAGQGISVDFIGSDKLDAPELHNSPQINFLNLRGDQNEDAPLLRKVVRILTYMPGSPVMFRARRRGSFICSGIINSSTSTAPRSCFITVASGSGWSLPRTTSTPESAMVETVSSVGLL